MDKTQGTTNPSKVAIQVIQANLQKPKLVKVEIGNRINKYNKLQEKFIIFVQEPMVGNNRAVWQPNSCKKFSIATNPRAMIYIDNSRQGWFMETFSNRDLAVVQTKIYNKNVLLISAYLSLIHI